MRAISWTCDKCGEAIHVGRVTLQAMTGGAERRRRPEIDLCSQCTAALWSWLDDSPAPAAEASPGRARRVGRRLISPAG